MSGTVAAGRLVSGPLPAGAEGAGTVVTGRLVSGLPAGTVPVVSGLPPVALSGFVPLRIALDLFFDKSLTVIS